MVAPNSLYGGLIPENLVEEVFSRADILDVIAEHVRLEKKGKNFVGLCPFHQEKTPSFTVTPARQMFYCFGCGLGGNVFRFLMLKESLSFPESVRYLAGRVGVDIPVTASPREEKYERYYRVNEWARDFFRERLEAGADAGEARSYLMKRGLTPEVRDRFQLGFAPPAGLALTRFLEQKGCAPAEPAELGLVVKGERGYYDRFRNRIIFPVWNASGRVVGFGGRVLDDSRPKYLNSPETPVFQKGRALYALHLARPAMRDEGRAVIVEGYLDAITAHQFGIRNAVASLGTSLTREQGRLLMRYTMEALIAYDADVAGVAAAIRGLDLLQEVGCRVRVISVPAGKDPDDFLREEGMEGWSRLIRTAAPLLEYKLMQIGARTGTATAVGRLAVLREVMPNLRALASEVEREEGFQTAARMLGLTWETIRSEYAQFAARTQENWANSDNIAKNMHNILTTPSQVREKTETGLLRLVLQNPPFLETVRQELGEYQFRDARYQRIYDAWWRRRDRPGFGPALLANYLEDGDQQVLMALMGPESPEEGNLGAELAAYIKAVKRLDYREQLRELLNDVAAAERAGDPDRVNRLMRKIQEVSKTP